MIGFGGLGVFGDIPRFTESRVIKAYKGVLGQLFRRPRPFMRRVRARHPLLEHRARSAIGGRGWRSFWTARSFRQSHGSP